MPEVGDPVMLYFPSPLHPFEAVAALRGFGGVRKADPKTPQHGAKVIAGGREAADRLEYLLALGKFLFWSEARTLLAAHLLIPFEVHPNYRQRDVSTLRAEVWAALGFTGTDVYDVTRGDGYGNRLCDFWQRSVFEWKENVG